MASYHELKNWEQHECTGLGLCNSDMCYRVSLYLMQGFRGDRVPFGLLHARTHFLAHQGSQVAEFGSSCCETKLLCFLWMWAKGNSSFQWQPIFLYSWTRFSIFKAGREVRSFLPWCMNKKGTISVLHPLELRRNWRSHPESSSTQQSLIPP